MGEVGIIVIMSFILWKKVELRRLRIILARKQISSMERTCTRRCCPSRHKYSSDGGTVRSRNKARLSTNLYSIYRKIFRNLKGLRQMKGLSSCYHKFFPYRGRNNSTCGIPPQRFMIIISSIYYCYKARNSSGEPRIAIFVSSTSLAKSFPSGDCCSAPCPRTYSIHHQRTNDNRCNWRNAVSNLRSMML